MLLHHYLLSLLLCSWTYSRPKASSSWFYEVEHDDYDDSSWFHEVEQHDDDHVLSSTSLFYKTFKQIQAGMSMYAPALHTGKINRGNFQKPELLHPKYRAMGWNSDFDHEDTEAFNYEPSFPNQRCVEVKKTRPGFDCRCGILRRKEMDPYASVLGTIATDGTGARMPAMEEIIGGITSEPNEYPWQVGVKFRDKFPYCGGSILSSKTILTSAHCLEKKIWWKLKLLLPKDFKVLVAAHDWPKEDYEEYAVHRIHRHPNWNGPTLKSDFAILELRDEINFHLGAQPICLPSLPGDHYEGVQGIATGWGLTAPPVPPKIFNPKYRKSIIPDKLQEANLTTMTNSACKHYFKYLGIDRLITYDKICAKGDDQYVCNGDSGGPLVVQEPCGHYTLVGATSFGPPFCVLPLEEVYIPPPLLPNGKVFPRGFFPSVYARVTSVLQWIRDNMHGDTCPPPSMLVNS